MAGRRRAAGGVEGQCSPNGTEPGGGANRGQPPVPHENETPSASRRGGGWRTKAGWRRGRAAAPAWARSLGCVAGGPECMCERTAWPHCTRLPIAKDRMA
eukprot:scaffold9745_cov112-Isochrysis_galbana.AAC.4